MLKKCLWETIQFSPRYCLWREMQWENLTAKLFVAEDAFVYITGRRQKDPGGFRTQWAGRSMVKAAPLSAYDAVMAQRRASRELANGRQPGDPAHAAQAILAVVESEHPPLRLPLGADAVTIIRQHLQQQL